MERTIETVRLEISNERKNLQELINAKNQLRKDLGNSEHDLKGVDIALESMIRLESAQGLNRHIAETVAPYKESISKLKNTIKELEAKQQKSLKDLAQLNTVDKALQNSIVNSEVKDLIGDLKKVIESELSEQFVKEYYKQLGSLIVPQKSATTYIKRIKKLKKEADIKFNNFVLLRVENFIEFLENQIQQTMEALNSNGIPTILKYVVPVGVLALLSPVMISINTFVAIQEFRKSVLCKKIIVYMKVVEDNIDLIEKEIRSKYEAQVTEAKSKITSKFSDEINKHKEKITQLKEEEKIAETEAKNGFVFDKSELNKQAEQRRKNFTLKITENQNRLEQLDKDINDLKLKIEKLKEDLEAVTKSELEKYLKPLDEVKGIAYPEKILLNMDPQVEFYTGIDNSHVISYKKRDSVFDLINLMIFQIRNIVDAGLLSFKIIDKETLGREFSHVYKHVKENEVAPLKLLIKAEDILPEVEFYRKNYFRAYELIALGKKKTIKEFNEDMLAEGSVPSKYEILFWLDPEFNNIESLEQVIRNGSNMGFYIYYFLKDVALTKDYIPVLEATQKFAYLTEESLIQNTIEAVIETLEA